MREAKAESPARELRELQLPLIDGLEGLTHTVFKFAAVAATEKESDIRHDKSAYAKNRSKFRNLNSHLIPRIYPHFSEV